MAAFPELRSFFNSLTQQVDSITAALPQNNRSVVAEARREPWTLNPILDSMLLRFADSDDSARDGTYRLAEVACSRGKALLRSNRMGLDLPSAEKLHHPAVAHLKEPSAKEIKFTPYKDEIGSLKRIFRVNKVAQALSFQLRCYLTADNPDLDDIRRLAVEIDSLLVTNTMLTHSRAWMLRQLAPLQPEQRDITKETIERRLDGQFAEAEYKELKRVRKQVDAEMRLTSSFSQPAAERQTAQPPRSAAPLRTYNERKNFTPASAPQQQPFTKGRKGDPTGAKAESAASGPKH